MCAYIVSVCSSIDCADAFNQLDPKWQKILDNLGVAPRPPTAFPLYPHKRKPVEPIIISSLAELQVHAARLDPEFLDPKYVGFDLELSKNQEIVYMQVSISDLSTFIFKIGEALKIQDVLLNNHVKAMLESNNISKVGVGIFGVL